MAPVRRERRRLSVPSFRTEDVVGRFRVDDDPPSALTALEPLPPCRDGGLVGADERRRRYRSDRRALLAPGGMGLHYARLVGRQAHAVPVYAPAFSVPC